MITHTRFALSLDPYILQVIAARLLESKQSTPHLYLCTGSLNSQVLNV